MEQESTIHGIGDEVVTSVLASTVIGAYMIFYLWRYVDIGAYFARAATPEPTTESSGVVHRVGNMGDEKCVICLTDLKYPVETNCAHLFCAGCLLQWLEGTGNRPSTTSCPACRSHVSVLLKCYDAAENDSEGIQLLRRVNQYNRRYSGEPRPWIEHMRDLPALLRHIANEFFSLGGLMYMFRLRIFLCFVAAVAYLITPLDVIPEAVFGVIGFCDDIFVVVLLGVYMTIIYRRFLASRWADDQ